MRARSSSFFRHGFRFCCIISIALLVCSLAEATQWKPFIPPSVDLVGQVAVLEWEDTHHFANELASRDAPAILRKTPSDEWPARKWDLNGLREALSQINGGVLEGVKKSQERQFRYYHISPMLQHRPFVEEYKESTFVKINMTASKFFDYLLRSDRGVNEEQQTVEIPAHPHHSSPAASVLASSVASEEETIPKEDAEWYSYAGRLDSWGDALYREALPATPFIVLPHDFKPSDEPLSRFTHVWLSPAGAVTPLHHDVYHNFYHQLIGRKHFLLMPPTMWEQVYLYPLLHPGGRSSQLDFGLDDPALPRPHRNTDSNDQTRVERRRRERASAGLANDDDDEEEEEQEEVPFPHFRRPYAVEAILEPGDVLYLPPMWFHQVSALEASASVSIWSAFEPALLQHQAIEQLVLPISSSWPARHQSAALRLFVDSLVASLGLGSSAGFVDWTLRQSRYTHFRDISTVIPAVPWGDLLQPRFCFDEDALDAVLAIDGVKDQVTASLKSVVKTFKQIEELGGDVRRDILLADFIELTVVPVTGPAQAPQFFHDIVHC